MAKWKIGSAVASVLAGLIAFQNCGQILPLKEVIYAQSSFEFRTQTDQETLKRAFASGNLKIWASAQDSTGEPGSGNVSSIPSRLGGMDLNSTNPSLGPRIEVTEQKKKIYSIPNGVTLVAAEEVASSTYSAVFVLFGPLNGNLLKIAPGDDSDELSLAVENGFLVATQKSANGRSVRKHLLEEREGPIVIAVSFGQAPGDMTVLVDGRKVMSEVETVGEPNAIPVVFRQIRIGGSSALALGEVMVLADAFNGAGLNTLSRFVAENWDYKGVIYDLSLHERGGDGSVDRLPAEVQMILAGKCTSCHAHTNWIYSNSYFVSQGLVVPKNYLASKMYYRLIGSEGSNPNKNMPVGNVITASEVEAIKNWIQSL